MMRLVPRNNVIGLAIPPLVWLGYFVATFIISALGCERGWHEIHVLGVRSLQLALWMTAVVGFGLLAFATFECWQHLRLSQDPHESFEPDERERRSFLARAGLFICGIALLGTAWGTLNMMLLPLCSR